MNHLYIIKSKIYKKNSTIVSIVKSKIQLNVLNLSLESFNVKYKKIFLPHQQVNSSSNIKRLNFLFVSQLGLFCSIFIRICSFILPYVLVTRWYLKHQCQSILSTYHIRWLSRVPCKMTNHILLRWPSKVRYINSGVSLDRSSSPSLLCSHWLGHLPSLASPTCFARSHGFIECYMEC